MHLERSNIQPMAQEKLSFGGDWTGASVLRGQALTPVFRTSLGILFEGDCVEILPQIKAASIDMVFADPPFNIGKKYGGSVKDDLPEKEYLDWCKKWMDQCIRVLKPGGAFFLYNIPRWNIILGAHLFKRKMQFRHDIAVDLKLGLPIPKRLYPAHYSLLYFTKGTPRTFRSIRIPIDVCRHCGKEIKDYGGHRAAMNPKGVNLTDVWTDIPPVRHRKFKSKKRKTNQLSTKLLRRVVELSTHPGDIVLDPFGGSGTTFDVAERLHRHWVGIEKQFTDVIVERLQSDEIHHHATSDFVDSD